MSREPIHIRRIFQTSLMREMLLWEISRRFHRLCPRYGQVAHVLRTLPPVAVRVLLLHAAPRLACVKPAASVHPEPGSNSSLYNILFLLACPDTYNFTKKLTLLDKLYFLGTCFLYSFSLFNELLKPLSRTRFSNGAAKVRIILKLPNFYSKFFDFHFLRQS